MYNVTWESADTLTVGIYVVVILGQSLDVQCNLGICGYSDSKYICSWPSSDSPRMYNVTWESVDTLTIGSWPSSDNPRMYNDYDIV